MFENKKKECWKNFRLPFCSFFLTILQGPIYLIWKKLKWEKISICKCKIFLLFDMDFFCQLYTFRPREQRKFKCQNNLQTKGHSFQICKWIVICHFKFFDMIEEMGSCQSQTPNWIPIHFLFSSLLIWFTIYHWPHPAPTALPNPSTDSSALPVA